MDYSVFKNNICDMLQEMQLKLGYCEESVRLYYPLSSINSFLNSSLKIEDMQNELEKFCDYVKKEMGPIEISHEAERFCILLSPKASEYVHDNYPANPFLRELVSVISAHCRDINDIINIFKKYSSDVRVEEMSDEDFDYRICFDVDEYVYYFKNEGCHYSYHRFTMQDDPYK